MGVREIDRSLEQWKVGEKNLRRRMILAPTPRERERWYAMLLLAQGWTAAATAEVLERAPTLSDAGGRPSAREGLRPCYSSRPPVPLALDQAQQEKLKAAACYRARQMRQSQQRSGPVAAALHSPPQGRGGTGLRW